LRVAVIITTTTHKNSVAHRLCPILGQTSALSRFCSALILGQSTSITFLGQYIRVNAVNVLLRRCRRPPF
jgi:hypothetical protein